jgi:hypothetical protein
MLMEVKRVKVVEVNHVQQEAGIQGLNIVRLVLGVLVHPINIVEMDRVMDQKR